MNQRVMNLNEKTSTNLKTLDELIHADMQSFRRFNNQFGFTDSLYGIDYQRCLEYPVALNQLKINSTVEKYLDVGSGKRSLFPLYIAAHSPSTIVTMTDLNPWIFKQHKRINKHSELCKHFLKGKIIIEQQDARKLSYDDEMFDRVSAVSSIEHIPGDGDSEALVEMIRVLKPGGRAVVTVPFQHNKYQERYSKLKKNQTQPDFFSHYYDETALYERFIKKTQVKVENILYLGEMSFPYFEFWCTKVPIRNTLKYFLGWINHYIALKLYRILPEEEKSKAHVAVLTFIKE